MVFAINAVRQRDTELCKITSLFEIIQVAENVIVFCHPTHSPLVIHVEELADELVDGVLGLQLDVHGQEEGGEEEDRAAQRDQLGRTLFDDSEAAKLNLFQEI